MYVSNHGSRSGRKYAIHLASRMERYSPASPAGDWFATAFGLLESCESNDLTRSRRVGTLVAGMPYFRQHPTDHGKSSSCFLRNSGSILFRYFATAEGPGKSPTTSALRVAAVKFCRFFL